MPQRISIVGATGSGKSVLARRLSEEWHLPLYELDRIFWDGRGRELPRQQFIRAVSDLTRRDAWILDGHYRAVRELIWRRADMVVWLNYPLWLVGFRLLQRFVRKRRAARCRGATPAYSEHRHDRRLQASPTLGVRLGRIVRTVRERREYGRLLKAPEYRDVKLVELRSVRATEVFVRTQCI